MKILYIDDKIHEQLKKEAKQQGRTLKWLVEEKLTVIPYTDTMASKYPPIEEIQDVTFVPDSQEWGGLHSIPVPDNDPRRQKLDDMFKSGQIKKGL